MIEQKETVITPTTESTILQMGEVWGHRDLLRYLIVREIHSSYANTSIGIFWVLLQPLLTALVLTLIFSILIRVPTEGIPYPLVILSAYPFYLYLNSVVMRSANSMRANAHLLTKVYFPKLIIVLVPLIAGLIDLAVLLAVVLLAAPFFGTLPSMSWFALSVPIVLVVILAFGVGLWLSQLTVYVADVGPALPALFQVLLFLSPIVYPIALVPDDWRWLYDLNPLVGIIEAARWALLDKGELPVYALSTTIGICISILVSGLVFFRLLEDASADVV